MPKHSALLCALSAFLVFPGCTLPVQATPDAVPTDATASASISVPANPINPVPTTDTTPGCITPIVAQNLTCTCSTDDTMGLYGDADELSGLGRRRTGWAQSGQLITANTNQFVSLQADFQESDTYLIEIGANPPLGGAMTEAIITWTVAGNQVSRRVTVGSGVSIAGAGEAVRVQVVDTTDVVHYLFGPGVPYPVTISVARGVRATTMVPPTLVPGATGFAANDRGPGYYFVPPGTVLTIPIPAGVGVVSAFVTALDVTGASTVGQQNAQAFFQNTFAGVFEMAFPVNLGTWVPVPPGAGSLNLSNLNAAPGGHGLSFGVAFGIDG